ERNHHGHVARRVVGGCDRSGEGEGGGAGERSAQAEETGTLHGGLHEKDVGTASWASAASLWNGSEGVNRRPPIRSLCETVSRVCETQSFSARELLSAHGARHELYNPAQPGGRRWICASSSTSST